MSYVTPVAPVGPRPRPGVVTAAGYLLYAVAAAYLVIIIVSLSTARRVIDTTNEIYARDGFSDPHGLVSVAIYGAAVVQLLIAAFLVTLAVFVLRGSNAMRITTWVIAGLGLLCNVCGLVGRGFSTTLTQQQNGITKQDTVALNNALPSWAAGTTLTIQVLVLVALALTIILLLRSSSNEYFRKPVPMMMMAGYPAYPTYPPVIPQQTAPPTATAAPGDSTWAPPGATPPGTTAPGSVPPGSDPSGPRPRNPIPPTQG